MKKVRIVTVFHIIVSCFLVISVCTALWAQEEKKRKLPEKLEEFEIKAGFFSSFAAYCTWPAGSTAESNDVPFTVGAFKKDEIITFLIEKIKDQFTVNGEKKDLDILRLNDTNYHIIYKNKHLLDEMIQVV